ncbi:MAG: hypothetical protein ACLVCH_13985 [Roseburia inulinivorans]
MSAPMDYLLAAMAYHFKKYDVASKCIDKNPAGCAVGIEEDEGPRVRSQGAASWQEIKRQQGITADKALR